LLIYHRPEIKNKVEYGTSYYQDRLRKMGKGYVHPYHTEDTPLFYSYYAYMKLLFSAVGPEQVSPHYESLSRSRRGLLFYFFYISSIQAISSLGGIGTNDWLTAMMFHQEFLISLFLCNIETRHWAWSPGPKFSIFYHAYTRYEYAQLCGQWADDVEEKSKKFLTRTKEQIEYVRIAHEYDFIKKRAMVNYLSNSRNELERHFHSRTQNMLTSIERFETNNLKSLMNSMTTAAVAKVNDALADPAQRERILQASFESALIGIRTGRMEYVNDPILPILTDEIKRRTSEFKNLTPAEEGKLLSLTADQKRMLVDSDKKTKAEFLHAVPSINNPGVKMNPKFKAYTQSVGAGSSH
jgi:hypothetical protein